MNEYKISDYGIFNDAISTTSKVNESLTNNQTTINDCSTNLNNESVFMGPICDVADAFGKKVRAVLDDVNEASGRISIPLDVAAACM